jgi:hypothetical protein
VAEDLANSSAAVDAPRDERATVREPFVRAPREQEVAYRMRFALAYLALAAIAGAAIGAAIVLGDRPADEERVWSQWQPTGVSGQYPTQIAEHVSSRYRDAQNRKLVTVFAGPPEIGRERLLGVAIEADTGRPEDAAVDGLGTSVMYQLCGGGESCAFRDGSIDAARLSLLRREGLELALYSFAYVDDLDSVIALLPPYGEQAQQTPMTTLALFFRRGDLRDQLEAPLAATLPDASAHTAAPVAAPRTLALDRLTRDRVFEFTFTRIQTGSPILLLRPFGTALPR